MKNRNWEAISKLNKMSDATILIFLSVVMLVGSYIAGSVPLIMTLSEVSLSHSS